MQINYTLNRKEIWKKYYKYQDNNFCLDNNPNLKVIGHCKTDNYHLVDCKTQITGMNCPNCNTITSHVHGKTYTYPHLGNRDGLAVIARILKYRYICHCCNKTITSRVRNIEPYHQISNVATDRILQMVKWHYNYTQIARQLAISVSSIIRYFDKYNIKRLWHYKVKNISVDETRILSTAGKYQLIILDSDSKKIITILPNRNKATFANYLDENFNKGQLETVTMDLWRPYKDAINKFDPSIKIIADKFHFVRQIMWDFEEVRKTLLREHIDSRTKSSHEYRLLKNNSRLLCKRNRKLNLKGREKVNKILACDDRLYTAYHFKEQYLNLVQDASSSVEYKKLYNEFYNDMHGLKIIYFKRLKSSHYTWKEEIANAFDYHYSNGYIEGMNAKIKNAKRQACGFRNTERTFKYLELSIGHRKIV